MFDFLGFFFFSFPAYLESLSPFRPWNFAFEPQFDANLEVLEGRTDLST